MIRRTLGNISCQNEVVRHGRLDNMSWLGIINVNGYSKVADDA